MENKIKHLEFIQNVIARMNSNSFLIKGWTITIVSALFALAAKDSNINFAIVSYIVIPSFWVLDGFFISTEKQYVELYKETANRTEQEVDFNMDASSYNNEDRTWGLSIFSKTLFPFYGIMLLANLVIMFVIA
ncbi:MAG: hypothetical protein F9K37_11255 [Bacteroidales bacterium]|nr:MAG: hypothetical protein F9K37_11255 [Bacteroidales bacterium]